MPWNKKMISNRTGEGRGKSVWGFLNSLDFKGPLHTKFLLIVLIKSFLENFSFGDQKWDNLVKFIIWQSENFKNSNTL